MGTPLLTKFLFLAWNDCHHWKGADADTTGAETEEVSVLSAAHSVEGSAGKRAPLPPTAHSRVRRAGGSGSSSPRGSARPGVRSGEASVKRWPQRTAVIAPSSRWDGHTARKEARRDERDGVVRTAVAWHRRRLCRRRRLVLDPHLRLAVTSQTADGTDRIRSLRAFFLSNVSGRIKSALCTLATCAARQRQRDEATPQSSHRQCLVLLQNETKHEKQKEDANARPWVQYMDEPTGARRSGAVDDGSGPCRAPTLAGAAAALPLPPPASPRRARPSRRRASRAAVWPPRAPRGPPAAGTSRGRARGWAPGRAGRRGAG